MRAAASIPLIACLALGACTSGPKPDLRLPVAYEAPQPSAATPAVALDAWWTTFHDPQLTTLIEQALINNPDAKTAAARLREASATRSSALTRFLPQGNPGYSFSRANTKGGFELPPAFAALVGPSGGGVTDSYGLNFNVSWEVDIFGRLFAAKHAADADVAAAGFDYITARTSLAAEVADAYFQARGLAIQLEDAKESARIERELYDVADRRGRAGLAATSEADRVAGDLAQSDAQVASLQAELQAQRRALLILAGRIVEPTSSVKVEAFVDAAPEVPASLPSDLLRRRPDVRSAEAQLAGAVGRKNVARLAFLPTFTLKPGYGWSKTAQSSGAPTISSTWTIGGAVTQPIFDIPNLLSQLKVYDARTEEAAAAYEKAVQTAFSESEGALVRLDSDRRRVALLTNGEARAHRAYKAALKGYQLGLNDLQTTLSSEQGWRSARTQLTSAQVQSVRQAVLAYKALGGGWTVGDPPPKPLAANPRAANSRAE